MTALSAALPVLPDTHVDQNPWSTGDTAGSIPVLDASGPWVVSSTAYPNNTEYPQMLPIPINDVMAASLIEEPVPVQVQVQIQVQRGQQHLAAPLWVSPAAYAQVRSTEAAAHAMQLTYPVNNPVSSHPMYHASAFSFPTSFPYNMNLDDPPPPNSPY